MVSFMQNAVVLAYDRLGFCAPNPSVGAVVVREGEIIGEGNHWACGEAHAEVVALQQAGDAARGADLYVTLVPCHHHGRTPPCTQAIIDAGIAKIYYASDDCGENVDTHISLNQLERAGVTCEKMPLLAVNDLYQSYRFWCQHRRPWVTLKLAQSLDGKIAYGDGRPAPITGPDLQRLTHEQRRRHDAILTTAKTIISDDPQLNVRLDGDTFAKPLLVLDSCLQTPLDARVWQSASSLTFFYHDDVDVARLQTFVDQGATCVPVRKAGDFLDWQAIMHYTGEFGYHSIWVEAGGILASELLQHHWVQQAFLYEGQCELGDQAWPGLTPEAEQVLVKAAQEWHQVGCDRLCIYLLGEPCLQG